MLSEGFPSDLKETVLSIVKRIPPRTYNDISSYTTDEKITYLLGEEPISFPYRVYFHEIDNDAVLNMSHQEKMILHCIYSRSCDGFVRGKHINALLSMDFPQWAIPYIVKVCDEYVVEILETVYDKLKGKNTDYIKQFCAINRTSFCKSYNRMISYWNEFYRSDCYQFKNYIGRRLFIECFGASRTMNCPKLTLHIN